MLNTEESILKDALMRNKCGQVAATFCKRDLQTTSWELGVGTYLGLLLCWLPWGIHTTSIRQSSGEQWLGWISTVKNRCAQWFLIQTWGVQVHVKLPRVPRRECVVSGKTLWIFQILWRLTNFEPCSPCCLPLGFMYLEGLCLWSEPKSIEQVHSHQTRFFCHIEQEFVNAVLFVLHWNCDGSQHLDLRRTIYLEFDIWCQKWILQ